MVDRRHRQLPRVPRGPCSRPSKNSGFETVEWVDETAWVLDWFQGLGGRLAAAGTAATLSPALLTDGPARMMNYAGALNNGILTIHRGAFTLAR